MKALKGLGPRTQEKLLEAMRSEDGIVEAAENLELDRFLAIRGISARKAVEIMSQILGLETFPFARTDAAQSIYEDILQRIRSLANTSYGRNKVLLLRPLRSVKSREALLNQAMAAKERVRQLPWDRVASLLSRLPALRNPRPVFDSKKVVVVEDEATLRMLEPYARYCEVLLPNDVLRPENYDLILYVSNKGSLDFDGVDQVHVFLGRPEPWQIFPETVVDFFRANEGLLQVLKELGDFVDGIGVAEEVLALLPTVRAEAPVPREDDLRDILDRVNDVLKSRLSRLSLDGEELLELLEEGLPKRLQEVFVEVLEEGEDEILRRTGFRVKLETTYPLVLPEKELERAVKSSKQRAKMESFEALQRAARLLAAKEEEVRGAYRRALEFDFEMTLGAFALHYDLQPPRWGSELRLRGALHLGLEDDPRAQRVDYSLSDSEGISLLTGANSGGKTTLLETLAQVYILATMGLPVNAREAILEPIEACYFFSRQRPLTAGALEGFLKTFMPLALDKSRKLVLADELEAMTEPEAAAAIIAIFLNLLKESNSYAVVVTHAARSILQMAKVRVDGIEAQGLDESYNLVVDRTPKPNVIARSTPELILQRLSALRQGEEAHLYRLILGRLQSTNRH